MASTLGSPAGVDQAHWQVVPRAILKGLLSRVRRGIDFGVLVLILLLVLRTWLFEGLLIPVRVAGPSMATAFLGPHASVKCHACGFTFDYALPQGSDNGQPPCPNCGQRVDPADARAHRGDRLGIDKVSLCMRAPRRWEAVIFRCPRRSSQYCVKRIVGFPGERIWISDGDVYVDDRIAQKSINDLSQMAILVHDANYRQRDVERKVRGWRWAATSGWKSTTNGIAFDAPTMSGGDMADQPTPDWCCLEGQPITDDYAYNPSLSRELNVVKDLLLSAQVTARGSGWLYLRLRGHQTFVVQMYLKTGQGRLHAGGKRVHQFEFPPDLLSRRVAVQLSTVDNRLQLAVDGATLLVHADNEPTETNDTANADNEVTEFFQSDAATSESQVAIGAIGLSLQVANLQVWRDVYYTDVMPTRRWAPRDKVCVLGPDEYFVLGDNSPVSNDSRWDTGRSTVPRAALLGLPLTTD